MNDRTKNCGIKFRIEERCLTIRIERDRGLPPLLLQALSAMALVVNEVSCQLEIACGYFQCFERLPHALIMKPIMHEIKKASEELEVIMLKHGFVPRYPSRFKWKFLSAEGKIDFCQLENEYWFWDENTPK